MDYSSNYGDEATRGPGRRQKILGYLKEANEIRKTYQTQLQNKWQGDYSEDSMPREFSDVEIIRKGDEEMLLFPSYARRHFTTHDEQELHPRAPRSVEAPVERPESIGDAEYWKREWQRYEDANAVIDVDVRGWIFSPHRTPLNRKNRLLLAVARRLSGLPVPTGSPGESRDPSMQRGRAYDPNTQEEEMTAAREAEHIAKHGQREAEAAARGRFSANADSPLTSRSPSPLQDLNGSRPTSLVDNGENVDDPGHHALFKRQSWNNPGNMNRDELSVANDHLMTRLKPFMTVPSTHLPITIFFYNEQKSESKTVATDDSGRFNVRAALSFVPTHVRVLASENLSTTETVRLIEPQGVSLVSDIDDTIKHSAIASGAREIFKNTFIRELGDLTIKGVKEWYGKLAAMGVKLHYVSNSPWQLYPLLRRYFAFAGLPPGSFHLKQYTGMLQGIFEPAAERKRGSMERIMNDFPERKFILVGDSGEADLEVYTDVVLEHPGRVLAVFIRDVTTPEKKGFFDQAISHLEHSKSGKGSRSPRLSPRLSPLLRPLTKVTQNRPNLPARATTSTEPPDTPTSEPDLIDLTASPDSEIPRKTSTYGEDMLQLQDTHRLSPKPQAPNLPNKPSSLRSMSTSSPVPSNHDRLPPATTPDDRKAPPPKPRRPSSAVAGPVLTSSEGADLKSSKPPDLPTRTAETKNKKPPAPPPLRNPTFRQINKSLDEAPTPSAPSSPRMRPRILARFNSSSNIASSYPPQETGYATAAQRQMASTTRSDSPSRATTEHQVRPVPPPRRGITSYPAAAARWATGSNLGDPAAGGDGGAPPGAPYDKKLEIWKRRWARAEEIMRSKGIVLRTWRVGTDVMDECLKLVEKTMEEIDRQKTKENARHV